MYDELVKRLRTMADWAGIGFFDGSENVRYNLSEAADAIEELEFACNRYEKDYKALCAYLPKWIPVTERLPEKGMRVLCACRANIFCVLKWDGIDWAENPTHVYMRGFVTHWMPLPEPPKEET